MNKIKALLFDLDGTIVNVKKRYLNKIHKLTCKKLGLKQKSDKPSEKYWKTFNKIDIKKRTDNVDIFDELNPQFLKKHKKNYKIGTITSTHPKTAEKEMKYLKIHDLFDVIIYAHRNSKFGEKPSPDGIIAACKRLNIQPKNAIYFGDNNRDMLTAKKAGCKSVWVNRGQIYHQYNEKKVDPDFEIKNLTQIDQVIN